MPSLDPLDFVEEKIGLARAHAGLAPLVQIAVGAHPALAVLEVKRCEASTGRTLALDVLAHELEQRRLAAAAHARDNLDEVGVVEHERAFQIRGTLDQLCRHRTPFRKI